MDPYAIATIVSATSLGLLLLVATQLWVSARRMAGLKADLQKEKAGQLELISENLSLLEQVDQLQTYRLEFFNLRRDHQRAGSNLDRMCRIEAGLKMELEKATERNAVLSAHAASMAALEAENISLRQAYDRLLAQFNVPAPDAVPQPRQDLRYAS